MPQKEEHYVIIDPTSKNRYEIAYVDLWRITFGATGSYCAEVSKGRVGIDRKNYFAACMVSMAYGTPTEERAQRIIDKTMFPVDEYMKRRGREPVKEVVV